MSDAGLQKALVKEDRLRLSPKIFLGPARLSRRAGWARENRGSREG